MIPARLPNGRTLAALPRRPSSPKLSCPARPRCAMAPNNSPTISPRFALAGVALVALTLANAAGHGFYSSAAAFGAVVALAAALAACARGLDAPLRWPSWLGPAALTAAALA